MLISTALVTTTTVTIGATTPPLQSNFQIQGEIHRPNDMAQIYPASQRLSSIASYHLETSIQHLTKKIVFFSEIYLCRLGVYVELD